MEQIFLQRHRIRENSYFDVDPLTQEELRNIQDTMLEQDYVKLIATGKFFHEVSNLYEKAIDERAKYYTFTIPYSGEIEVVVKAHSEDDAKDYIHDMSHYDLSSYVDEYDIEFAEYDAYVESTSYDEPLHFEDATE